MSDNVRLHDAAGSNVGMFGLSLYTAGAVTLTAYDAKGLRIEYTRELSAATARKLAAALLDAAAASEQAKGAA